ncbi:MAG: PIN domain-containing protein [Proteobacteria bacterium]|nr:PIN domain-containing protein [Pseudomonadota bacterium]MBS0464449.1 PIN domain-containing protein [Pseudomonadota bacterium]
MGLIYLDACLVIYLAERHVRWGKLVADAMDEFPDVDFVISPLVKLECLVVPIRRADLVVQRAFADVFEPFGTLAMPESVYLQAAQLRARFGLKTPDALHLACAQHHRCQALWTNDNRLAQASHGLARKILK